MLLKRLHTVQNARCIQGDAFHVEHKKRPMLIQSNKDCGLVNERMSIGESYQGRIQSGERNRQFNANPNPNANPKGLTPAGANANSNPVESNPRPIQSQSNPLYPIPIQSQSPSWARGRVRIALDSGCGVCECWRVARPDGVAICITCVPPLGACSPKGGLRFWA